MLSCGVLFPEHPRKFHKNVRVSQNKEALPKLYI